MTCRRRSKGRAGRYEPATSKKCPLTCRISPSTRSSRIRRTAWRAWRCTQTSAFAARVLKAGRLCVVYCGKHVLPDYFTRLGEHLEYMWTAAILLPGRHNLFHRKRIFGRWRPVAMFSAGPYKLPDDNHRRSVGKGSGGEGPQRSSVGAGL